MADIDASIPDTFATSLPNGQTAPQLTDEIQILLDSIDVSHAQGGINVGIFASAPTVPEPVPPTPPIVIQGGTVEGSSAFNQGMN